MRGRPTAKNRAASQAGWPQEVKRGGIGLIFLLIIFPSPHQPPRHRDRRLCWRTNRRAMASSSGSSWLPKSAAWMSEITNRQGMPKLLAPSRSVRTESPSGEHARRSPSLPRALRFSSAVAERLVVDRAVRLAGEDHLAAEIAVELRQRAGAKDELVAALDHEVGVGADHRHAAGDALLQHLAIVVGMLGLFVHEADVDDVVGVLEAARSRSSCCRRSRRSRCGPR